MVNFNKIKLVIVCVFVIVLFQEESFGRGGGGSYSLTGFAVSSNGDTLRNQIILYYFKDKIDTIITDSEGRYKVEVRWKTACPSVGNRLQTRRRTRRYNPKYIYFSCEKSKIKVRNHWKKHFSFGCEVPQKTNLIFKP